MKKYSKDKLVSFDSLFHTYYLGNKKLQSVTSFINQFKQPFDSDTIAESYAKKHGLEKEFVLNKWKLESEMAANKGTLIHKIFEDYILYKEIKLPQISKKEKIAEKFIIDFFETNRLIPIETELIVYNDTLAGQVDCIAKDVDNNYYILDWKTNKSIEKKSFNDKKMLPPYDIFPDCNFYHYSMQLSLYKSMINNYKIKDCYIIHIDENEYKFIKCLDIAL